MLVLLLVRWLASLARDASPSPYRLPMWVMVALGLPIGTLTVLGRDWTYTPLFLDGASGFTPHLVRHGALAAVFLAGACSAAVVVGLFRLQRGSLVDWAREAGGGGIMGIGARLVPGGNDAMLFVGLPFLLPNMVVAYCTMNVALLVLTTIAKNTTRVSRQT